MLTMTLKKCQDRAAWMKGAMKVSKKRVTMPKIRGYRSASREYGAICYGLKVRLWGVASINEDCIAAGLKDAPRYPATKCYRLRLWARSTLKVRGGSVDRGSG